MILLRTFPSPFQSCCKFFCLCFFFNIYMYSRILSWLLRTLDLSGQTGTGRALASPCWLFWWCSPSSVYLLCCCQKASSSTNSSEEETLICSSALHQFVSFPPELQSRPVHLRDQLVSFYSAALQAKERLLMPISCLVGSNHRPLPFPVCLDPVMIVGIFLFLFF